MPNREPTPNRTGVLQGTLDLMILKVVASLGPVHGYTIAERLAQISEGALQLNMGTLYPGLVRLEQRGLLRAAWAMTDSNRRARFYTLTTAGRRRLEVERQEWARMADIMRRLLDDTI